MNTPENCIEDLRNKNSKRENELVFSNCCSEDDSEEEIYGKKIKQELNEKLETNSNTNTGKNTVNFINKKKIRDSNISLLYLENQNSKRFNDIHLISKKKNEDKNCIKKVENGDNHLNVNIKSEESLNEEKNKKSLNDNNIKNEEILYQSNIQNKIFKNTYYTRKEEKIINDIENEERIKDEAINPFFSINENFIIY